jgi:hypothetical protein
MAMLAEVLAFFLCAGRWDLPPSILLHCEIWVF